MKRNLIIGVIIIVLIVVLVWIFYPRPTGLLTCLQEGELSFDESTGENFGECCAGLTEIGDVFYDSSKTCEEILGIVGYGSICSNCRNNICESWENRCNCPQDCKNP